MKRHEKPITELNENHLATFKKFVEKWLEIFGIKSYVLTFKLKKMDCLASIGANVRHRSAKFQLATVWERLLPTDNELEKAALHECLHLLHHPWDWAMEEAHAKASKSNLPYRELYESFVGGEEESVVMTLETVLMNLQASTVMPVASSSPITYKVVLINYNGNIINAIKAVREMTNIGLKEAKDLCDLCSPGHPVTIVSGVSKDLAYNYIEVSRNYKIECLVEPCV